MKYAKDQSDKSLDFNGQAGDGVNRAGKATSNGCYAGNYSGKTMPMNVGRGPNKGNASSSTGMSGSATRDPKKHTIATAAQSKNPDAGGATVKGFSNPDKINVGTK